MNNFFKITSRQIQIPNSLDSTNKCSFFYLHKLLFLGRKNNIGINLQVFVLIVIISVFSSCHKDEKIDLASKDSIAGYEAFYNQQMFNRKTKISSNMLRRKPRWHKTKLKKWNRGRAAVVPLEYSGNYSIRTTTSAYSMDLEASSYLMINKNRNGEMSGEIVYLIPDGLNYNSEKGTPSRFSGTIVIEDLHGNFLAAYTHKPNGQVFKHSNYDAKNSNNDRKLKSVECITYEFWQKTSIDGGETWSDPVLISSETECYYTYKIELTACFEYDQVGGGGSGGSGGSGGNGGITYLQFRPLSIAETQKLNNLKEELLADCAKSNVVNTIWNNVTFNMNSSIGSPAQYNAKNNTISFKSSEDIKENNLIEELFHAYQNTVYSGGIEKYRMGKPGFTNIEFEAKLFKDICNMSVISTVGQSATFGITNEEMNSKYTIWVMDIICEGFTPKVMAKYSEMLGYFNKYRGFPYGGHLLASLNNPIAIKKSQEGCN